MRSPASNASSRPACGASATRLIRLLLTRATAAAREPACDVRPPGPQADRATALPNYLGSDLKCLRSENGLRFCYRVVVGTCVVVRCFPPLRGCLAARGLLTTSACPSQLTGPNRFYSPPCAFIRAAASAGCGPRAASRGPARAPGCGRASQRPVCPSPPPAPPSRAHAAGRAAGG